MATYRGTINDSKISGTLTDFPEVIDLSQMPSGFWSTVKSDGGDIRIYEESSLTTEMPRQIISIDTGTQTGFVFTKHGSVSSGNVIYIDVDGVRSNYASSDPFGSENVWNSNYEGVYNEGAGTDSTSNGNNAGTAGGLTEGGVNGLIGNATDYDGGDDYTNVSGLFTGIGSGDFTITGIFNPDSTGDGLDAFVGNGDNDGQASEQRMYISSESAHIRSPDGGSTFGPDWSASISSGNWYHFVIVKSGNTWEAFINGVSEGSDTDSAIGNAAPWNWANNAFGRLQFTDNTGTKSFYYDGKINRITINSVNGGLSSDWITTEANNQTDIANFRTWTELAQPVSIQKSLQYSVKTTPTAISKSLQYSVQSPVSIAKSLTYKVEVEVSGQVTLGGVGQSGVTVTIIDSTNDNVYGTDTTDGSGNYSFTVPSGNTWHVAVEYDDGGTKYNAPSKPFIST